MKHVANNRVGMIVDMIVTTATLLIVSLQLQVKGQKSHDNMRNQLFADAFGRDATTTPKLSNVEFQGDRGYFPENAFVGILIGVASSSAIVATIATDVTGNTPIHDPMA